MLRMLHLPTGLVRLHPDSLQRGEKCGGESQEWSSVLVRKGTTRDSSALLWDTFCTLFLISGLTFYIWNSLVVGLEAEITAKV